MTNLYYYCTKVKLLSKVIRCFKAIEICISDACVSVQCDLENWTLENKRLEKELETGEFAGMN